MSADEKHPATAATVGHRPSPAASPPHASPPPPTIHGATPHASPPPPTIHGPTPHASPPRPTIHGASPPRPTIHGATPHAHEHAHAHGGHDPAAASGSFPHEKLDAYHVAIEMAARAVGLAEQIPRGHRNVADHMVRAASNTVLLLAEGANRRGAGQKRQRFVESRGECAEVAAAADLLVACEIGSRAEAERLRSLASRVSAMLTRLIARLEG